MLSYIQYHSCHKAEKLALDLYTRNFISCYGATAYRENMMEIKYGTATD